MIRLLGYVAYLIFLGWLGWLCLYAIANPAELTLPIRPDPVHTPGAINPLATTAVLCTPGYTTRTIRPPQDYTSTLKRTQLAAYGYASRNVKLYEEDHLIPLELGGHPSDPRNLWPEVWAGSCGAHVKDDLENKLHELVCAGKLTLAEAQGEIAHDWVRAYNQHMGKALTCQTN